MKRLSNILVYAEAADEDCLGQVVALAARHKAKLTVCDVIEAPPGLPDQDGAMAQIKKISWQRAFESLRTLCTPHMANTAIDYTVLIGDAFIVITEQVIRQHFDLVVHISSVSARSRGLNPTGMHLVRKCPCPVWSMLAGSTKEPEHVVLAVDYDALQGQADSDQMALALAEATALITPPHTTLHIVHAWLPYGAPLLEEGLDDLNAQEATDYATAQERHYAAWLDGLAERLAEVAQDREIETHLVRGPVATVVLEHARSVGADLIVLGNVGTNTMPGVLISTSAEAILADAGLPSLALKPHGFISPLRYPVASRKSTQRLELVDKGAR